MKFGVTLPNFGKYASKGEILRIASAAEELGFESLWISDHVIIPEGHNVFGDVFYDPFITLSYIAAVTKNIKLATSVVVLPYRNPVVTAKMISTLDQLSQGRLILGVGSGWLEKEFEALGVDFDNRGAITDEYLEILKILWTEDEPRFNGKYFQFSDLKFLPKPYQQPFPPIWIGGGSNRAIKRAVEHGSGWHPVGHTPLEIKVKLEYLKKLLSKHNKSDFTVSLRRNLEITNKDINKDDTLRGPAEKIINGIKEYKNVGVDHLLLYFLSGSFDGVLEAMNTFSTKIKPEI